MTTMRYLLFVAAALVPTRAFQLSTTSHAPRLTALKSTTIAAADVKALRVESGAGMMDCKKALVANDGDKEKAAEWLRVKGLASAAKKGERATKEGLIETYVHTGGRLGVMVEVNCETDFVSKGEKFKELCKMLAMQIAACPSVEYVKFEDIPEATISKERDLEMKAEDLASKPDNIKEKIVEGRVTKAFKEKVLLEQDYIKDTSMNVDAFVKSYVATIGENIQVKRFTKFQLGGAVDDDDKEEAAPAEEDAPVVAEDAPADDDPMAAMKAQLKAELKAELLAELKA